MKIDGLSKKSDLSELKSWQTRNGNVALFVDKKGEISAKLFKDGAVEQIPRDRIKGLPERSFKSEADRAAFLSDTYSLVKGSKDAFFLSIHLRLKGGMFNPKPWGNGLAAVAGRGPVYLTGRGMGYSDLCTAATQGWQDDVERFIKRGDDINMVNTKGNTPLDDAIRERHPKIEQILRENGAKRSSEL